MPCFRSPDPKFFPKYRVSRDCIRQKYSLAHRKRDRYFSESGPTNIVRGLLSRVVQNQDCIRSPNFLKVFTILPSLNTQGFTSPVTHTIVHESREEHSVSCAFQFAFPIDKL